MPAPVYDSERYLRHFFLIAEPFSLTPDPDFLYLSDSHAEALAAIELGVMERRGLTVLTGEVGTGKTTLAHAALSQWRSHLHCAYLRTGTFTFEDILRQSLRQFGRKADGGVADCLERLEQFLVTEAASNRTVALLIDEAQNLPPETFEQLRLLLNFETEKQKLLQLVLVGQPELERRLQSPQLRHVAGRIAVRAELSPLSDLDCAKYIEHRLNKAGATGEIFARPALAEIVRASGGIPRRLNVLCHNALLFAYGREQAQVERLVARQAIRAAGGTRQPRQRGWWLAAGAAALVAALLVWWAFGRAKPVAQPPSSAVSRPPASALAGFFPRAPAAATVTAAAPATAAPVAAPPVAAPAAGERAAAAAEAPAIERRLARGSSLSELVFETYARYDRALLAEVRRLNPHITDPHHVPAGTIVRLPERRRGAVSEFFRVRQRLERQAANVLPATAASADESPPDPLRAVDLQPLSVNEQPKGRWRSRATQPAGGELPFGQVVQSGLLERLRAIAQSSGNPLVVLAGVTAREQLRPLLDQLVRQARATQVDLLALELEATDQGRRVREVSLPGENEANPKQEAAATDALDAWLAQVARGREVVVVGAPALLPSVDAALAARRASGLVLVAEAMFTPRAALAEATERAQAVGCAVHGVVLLGARRWLPRWLDRLLREVVD